MQMISKYISVNSYKFANWLPLPHYPRNATTVALFRSPTKATTRTRPIATPKTERRFYNQRPSLFPLNTIPPIPPNPRFSSERTCIHIFGRARFRRARRSDKQVTGNFAAPNMHPEFGAQFPHFLRETGKPWSRGWSAVANSNRAVPENGRVRVGCCGLSVRCFRYVRRVLVGGVVSKWRLVRVLFQNGSYKQKFLILSQQIILTSGYVNYSCILYLKFNILILMRVTEEDQNT